MSLFRNVLNLFTLAFTCCLFFTTCKRYPDGGTSFRARQIFNAKDHHAWDVHQYLVNGEDSTSFISSNRDPDAIKSYIAFFKYSRDNYADFKNGDEREIDFDGENVLFFGFANTFSGKNGSVIKNIFCPIGKRMTWRIRRCKKREMVLTSSLGTTDYKVVLWY